MKTFMDQNFLLNTKTAQHLYHQYASTMPYLIGNPLYHWTHLELQRYFNITTPLNLKIAP